MEAGDWRLEIGRWRLEAGNGDGDGEDLSVDCEMSKWVWWWLAGGLAWTAVKMQAELRNDAKRQLIVLASRVAMR